MSKLQNQLQEIISNYAKNVRVQRVCGNKKNFYANLHFGSRDFPIRASIDYNFPFGINFKVDELTSCDNNINVSAIIFNLKHIQEDIEKNITEVKEQ